MTCSSNASILAPSTFYAVMSAGGAFTCYLSLNRRNPFQRLGQHRGTLHRKINLVYDEIVPDRPYLTVSDWRKFPVWSRKYPRINVASLISHPTITRGSGCHTTFRRRDGTTVCIPYIISGHTFWGCSRSQQLWVKYANLGGSGEGGGIHWIP